MSTDINPTASRSTDEDVFKTGEKAKKNIIRRWSTNYSFRSSKSKSKRLQSLVDEKDLSAQSPRNSANEQPQCSKSPDPTDRVSETTISIASADIPRTPKKSIDEDVFKTDKKKKNTSYKRFFRSFSGNRKTREEILTNKLLKMMAKNPSKRDLIDLCHDVRECNSDRIATKVAAKFPEKADFTNASISSSDAHAISCVIKKVDKKIEKLDLRICRLTTESFRFICEAIQEMNGSIDSLYLVMNKLSGESVDDIVNILSNINVGLWMGYSIYEESDYRDPDKDELNRIQNTLKQISSKLKVHVGSTMTS